MLSDPTSTALHGQLQELLGVTQQHVQPISPHSVVQLQPLAAAAFARMQAAAAAAGHDLQIASGFRSFARQALIWQRKFTASSQDDAALAHILHWSALPGTSRHHWGSDMDVYSAAAIGEQQLQLVAAEYASGGPCWPLYQWLREHAHAYGFYWPYQGKGNGVAAEPWHLSYAPIARHYQPLWQQPSTLHAWANYLEQQQLTGLPLLLPQLQQLVERYTLQVAEVPKALAE